MSPLAALLALALAGLVVPASSGDLQPLALNLGLPDGLYADRECPSDASTRTMPCSLAASHVVSRGVAVVSSEFRGCLQGRHFSH